MPKFTSSSFVTEIPLQAGSHEISILKKRFWAAKQQYNALLGEALKRLRKMKNDARYKQAIDLYRKGEKKEAKSLFKELTQTYGYTEYSLNRKQWTGTSLAIGAAITQKLAQRAFQSVEAYRKRQRGKPRFKGHRGISSIEDKQPTTLRIKNNELHYLGIKLPLLLNPCNPIHVHGITSPVKYVRLVRRQFNNKIRYFAQLVCEGKPYVKEKNISTKGVVGIDVGPQTIAIVSNQRKHATLKVFADELKLHKKKKHKLERAIARRLRANNPEAYEAKRWVRKDKNWHVKQGKYIKGKRPTIRSKSLQKDFNHLADLARKQAAHRKSQHGHLVNQILSMGSHIKAEKLNYKAFQKLYGKSIGLRAPGMFIEHLKRKAENAGGKVEDINTWETKLSQACHCGRYEKKGLRKRWHTCPCGAKAQRDLYSAYLACFVEKNKLMADQAKKAWSGMDIALRTAMSKIKPSSSGLLPASLGLSGLTVTHKFVTLPFNKNFCYE